MAVTLALAGSSQLATVRDGSTGEPGELKTLRSQANALFANGSFAGAAALYDRGYRQALSANSWRAAVAFLNNLGGARFAAFQYAAAQDAFVEARRIASDHKDAASLGAVWGNLSSLYLQVGDLASSRHAAEQGLRAIQTSGSVVGYRWQLLAQLALLDAREGDFPSALASIEVAVEAAGQPGNAGVTATVLTEIGGELLRAGEYNSAEPYLVEGFRLRKLFHDRDLRTSYFYLSRLRLAQGDVHSAAVLIDCADHMPARDAGPPLWRIDHQRGEVQLAEGRIAEAVESFRLALDAAKAWREDAAPSDLSKTGRDIRLHELYRSFIDASVRLGRSSPAETFLAAEEDRSASLRRSVIGTSAWQKNLTPAYGEKLAQLRAAETMLVANETQSTRKKVERLRFDLMELESNAGYPATANGDKTVEKSSIGNTLTRIQRSIRADQALLSLYQGAKTTYLWALTGDGIEFHDLGPAAELTAAAGRFGLLVRAGSSAQDQAGERLYQALFGAVSRTILERPHWILSADDALFEIPFALLVAGRSNAGRPVYLVQEHSLQLAPGAYLLAESAAPPRGASFVGIGDGVYNAADPRWRPGSAPKPYLQLARLPASGRELAACARAWGAGGEGVVLTGLRASRQSLIAALGADPAVVHIAAHILHPERRPDQALIDLGFSAAGEAEILTREDIAGLRVPGAVVVMSGCSSAAAGSVPGAGVLGLMRAWMLAGAAAVVGSRWTTTDDTGELFQVFYRGLRSRSGNETTGRAAAALREAQIAMLESNSWRSEPAYWGTFYVLGKD